METPRKKAHGEDGIKAVERIAGISGVENYQEILEKLRSGWITDDILEKFEELWAKLPRTRYFWEHHVNKDLKIMQASMRTTRASKSNWKETSWQSGSPRTKGN